MIRTTAVLFLILSFTIIRAQDAFVAAAQKNLDAWNDLYEPEYVDLHTDRDYYFAGERMWYSLHIRNNLNVGGSLSLMAYVEIRGAADSVIIRQKIKCSGGRGHGEIILPRQLSTGYYKLTAYTLWMKNAGAGTFFQELLPIVNIESHLPSGTGPGRFENGGHLEVKKSEGNLWTIEIPKGFRGEVVGSTNEVVFFHERITSDDPVLLDLGKINDQFVTIQLIDADGRIVAGTEITQSRVAEVVLSAQRKEMPTRSTNEVSVELRDKTGYQLSGNISATLKTRAPALHQIRLPRLTNKIGAMNNQEPLPFRREVFIYPQTKGAPVPIAFSSAEPFAQLSSTLVTQAITEAEMKAKTMKAYNMQTFYAADPSYNVPSNNSYEPGHYASLPSIEEFIREVIPVIKVRKVKGQKVLLVRNADNPVNIHFFKQPALILVDGAIVKSADDLMTIPLADVERIDVLWGIKEINSLGVASLADNGVVVFQTKSRTAVPNSQQELFKHLHTPLIFTAPTESKEKATPRFNYPMYWNPDIRITGKGKLTLVTGDDVGDMVLEVEGYTDRGEFVRTSIDLRIVIQSE